MLLYNTLSRKKEEFKPMHAGKVNMFVCGQTVYDDAHLGHAKNYINFDVVCRWLKASGYSVRYVQNITDIDDKIIARASEQGTEPLALARKFEARFMEDMEAIGVRSNVSEYPRSHDYIGFIAEQIQLLLDKGYAYLLGQDVYYDVAKFEDYTKLSGMKISELEKHRIEPKQGKRHTYDFVLWKGSKQGEPSWDIKLTAQGEEHKMKGRPGWHIEDTAITYAIFGKQYDIHGGAIELIFPHHTNEIAQAQAAFGVRPFVRYWMHSGIMLIKGEKMSKSLKNFIRIRELLSDYDPEALRLLICSTHYRKDIAYSDALMKAAASRLRYLYSSLGVFYSMEQSASTLKCADTERIISQLSSGFAQAMDDDINTPLALSRLAGAIDGLRLYAETYPQISSAAKESAISGILGHAAVLGILQGDAYKQKLPDEASAMIKERERLRRAKDFARADEIRARLHKELGIVVEDSEYGTIWYRQRK